MKPFAFVAGFVVLIAAGFGIVAFLNRPYKPNLPVVAKAAPAKMLPAAAERQKLDILMAAHPKRAERAFRAFIATNASSPDPKVQEQVGLARFRVGYIQARRKDFGAARSTFLEASAKYKGPGVATGDFGGVKDGAEYQAAVCLVAEGKKQEARAAFLDFLRKEPTSPLDTAAYRRLVRLNGGKSLPSDEQLLQHDLTLQQKQEQLETAMCGPKVLARLLPLVGKPRTGYEDIAKICGTTKNGTTLLELRDALRHYGLDGYGAVVNRRDFALVPTPAVMSQHDHFVLILKIAKDYMEIYDPMRPDEASQVAPLPPLDDSTFQAMVLTLSPIHFDTSAVADESSPEPASDTKPKKGRKDEGIERVAKGGAATQRPSPNFIPKAQVPGPIPSPTPKSHSSS